MPLSDIFCPTCQRFVGNKEKCDHCDWVRPDRVGKLKWQTPAPAAEAPSGAPPFIVQITSVDDRLFVPTASGDILAYDAETGREIWRRTLRADRQLRTRAVAVWQDVLLIGCEHLGLPPTRDRALLAWRMSDAADAWSFPTNGDSLSVPFVQNDVAYFTSLEPRLYALDLLTQQLRWPSVPACDWSPDTPALFENTLVAPSRGPQLAAYCSQNGRQQWVFHADNKENEWFNYRPIVTADGVYTSGSGAQNKLYALDRAAGKARWRFRPERGFTCPPVLAGDTLLIGVKDYADSDRDRKPGYSLRALDAATGAECWRFRTDRHIQVAPTVIDDNVLLGADDRCLRALNLADGSLRWSLALPDKVYGQPLALGDTVIVGLRNGTLVCVWRQAERPVQPEPQVLLAQDRPLDAAVAYAVQGNFPEAASLLERHKHWREAAELWCEAGQSEKAAAAFAAASDYSQAVELYRHLNNQAAVAHILGRQGKHDEAAALYEELGNLELAVQEYRAAGRPTQVARLLAKANRHDQAAQLYAEANEYDQAVEEFIKAQQFAEAAAIYRKSDRTEAAIGVLIQGGLFIEAAQLNEQLKRWSSAAELYDRANQPDQVRELYASVQDWSQAVQAENREDLPRLIEVMVKYGQLGRAIELCKQTELTEKARNLMKRLRQGLVKCFTEEELKDICCDLEIDYEALTGVGKAGKARELVTHCDRRSILRELADECQKLRPKYNW